MFFRIFWLVIVLRIIVVFWSRGRLGEVLDGVRGGDIWVES